MGAIRREIGGAGETRANREDQDAPGQGAVKPNRAAMGMCLTVLAGSAPGRAMRATNGLRVRETR